MAPVCNKKTPVASNWRVPQPERLSKPARPSRLAVICEHRSAENRRQTAGIVRVREGVLSIHLQRRQKRRLRNLHLAELAHALLPLLLLLQKLALARDIAAVALRRHVLRQRADGLARDHPAADRGLDGDLEQLARDQ